MSEVEKKLDTVISEIQSLKEVLISQTNVLEDIVTIFTKYDQELLLEDDEIREG